MKIDTERWKNEITLNETYYSLMSAEQKVIGNKLGLHTHENGKTYFSFHQKIKGKVLTPHLVIGWEEETGDIFFEFHPSQRRAVPTVSMESIDFIFENVKLFYSVMAEHNLLKME